MISHERLRAIQLIAVGLLLKFGCPTVWLLVPPHSTLRRILLTMYLLGLACYIWGCRAYAHTKNRHGAWSCCGILCVVALPILAYIEDRSAMRQ
jgi:hypothetical protein